jgi:hypothetical protein
MSVARSRLSLIAMDMRLRPAGSLAQGTLVGGRECLAVADWSAGARVSASSAVGLPPRRKVRSGASRVGRNPLLAREISAFAHWTALRGSFLREREAHPGR